MGGYVTLFKRSFASFGTDKCASLAAAIAYYTIFSLFPMALVGISLLGFFVGDASARERVVNGLSGVITLGEEGEQAFRQTLSGIHRAKGWLGLVGLATALWSASGLFGAIRTALDRVWDVDRPLPLLRAKARDLLLFLGFGGLLGASAASTGVLHAAQERGAAWLGPLTTVAGPVFGLVAFVAPLLLTFAAFLFLYERAPHARLTVRDVLPAAVLAALFFEFGKTVLAYYILNMGNANALAGSLGAAILFLVFVYYAAQVVLLAAELAKHRLLVKEGTLPATDPKTETPKVPFLRKLRGTLVRLWTVQDVHHDAELPYEPSRLDPATNRPTNTREAVIVKWQLAQQKQQHDAGTAADGNGNGSQPAPAGGALAGGAPPPPRLAVIAGEARRVGDRLFLDSDAKVTSVTASANARITRDGKQVTLEKFRVGDWVIMTLGPDGTAQRLDAMTKMKSRAPAGGGGREWARATALVGPLLVKAFLMSRSSDDKTEKDRRKNKHADTKRRHSPLLRRQPSH